MKAKEEQMEATDFVPVVPPIPDLERSAYGLGYEYRRRNVPISSNPHELNTLKCVLFREGWFDKNASMLKDKMASKTKGKK